MIIPVTQAYVGDITPAGKEGFVMGLFNMSMFIGLSVGPLLGGVIHDRLSLEFSFLCMGLLSFVGFCLTIFYLPSTESEKITSEGHSPVSWRNIVGDRIIIGLFIFRFAYTASIGIIWGFLPIFASNEFNLPSSSIGFLIMLGIAVSGSIQTPLGYAADRWDRKRIVVIGGIILGVAVYSFRWADSFSDLVIASVVFGLGGGISMPALMAIAVVKGSQTDAMGSVISYLTLAHSLGMLTGAFTAGIIMDIIHLREAFLFGAIFMAIGIGVFIVCMRKTALAELPVGE